MNTLTTLKGSKLAGTHRTLWGQEGLGPWVTAPAWLRAALSMDPLLPWCCVISELQGISPDLGPCLPLSPAIWETYSMGAAGSHGSRGGSQRVPELEPEPERLPCVEGEGDAGGRVG